MYLRVRETEHDIRVYRHDDKVLTPYCRGAGVKPQNVVLLVRWFLRSLNRYAAVEPPKKILLVVRADNLNERCKDKYWCSWTYTNGAMLKIGALYNVPTALSRNLLGWID